MFELSCLSGVSRVGWANDEDDDVGYNDVIIQSTFWTCCYIKARIQSEHQVQFDSVCCQVEISPIIIMLKLVRISTDSNCASKIKLFYLCAGLSFARRSARSGHGCACSGSGCGTQPGSQSTAALLRRLSSSGLCISLLFLWLNSLRICLFPF